MGALKCSWQIQSKVVTAGRRGRVVTSCCGCGLGAFRQRRATLYHSVMGQVSSARNQNMARRGHHFQKCKGCVFPFTLLEGRAFSTCAGSKIASGINQSVGVYQLSPLSPLGACVTCQSTFENVLAFRLRVAARISKSALQSPLCICLGGTSDGSLTQSRRVCSDFSMLHPFSPHTC